MYTISSIIGWLNYMKYSDMNKLTKKTFEGTELGKCNQVNVYIDLGSMVESIYSESIIVEDPTELASVIINFAAHIRNYFDSYHQTYATIFFVYSDNEWPVLQKIYPRYTIKTSKKLHRNYNFIQDTMKIISMITDYIPSVYFIKRYAEVTAIIYATVMKEQELGNNNPNIIFSRETNMCQLPMLNDKTFIYYKKTYTTGYTCYSISNNNTLESFLKLTNRWSPLYESTEYIVYINKSGGKTEFLSRSPHTDSISTYIHTFYPRCLPAFIALTGIRSRKLNSMINWPRAIKSLSAINESNFQDNPIWIYDHLNLNTTIYNSVTLEDFVARYKIISVTNQAHIYNISKESTLEYRIDKDNSSELKYLNDHYFFQYPIMLNKF